MSYLDKSIGHGNIWTLAIGIGFTIWGAIALVFQFVFDRSFPGTFWLLIPGGIMIIAAISNIISYRYNREKILGALKSYERVSMEQLASELDMKENEVKEVIVDLRTEGRLKASFDPETGDVFILEVKGQPPMAVVPVSSSGLPEHEANIEKSNERIPNQGFCPYCGSMIKPGDSFCNNCGASQN